MVYISVKTLTVSVILVSLLKTSKVILEYSEEDEKKEIPMCKKDFLDIFIQQENGFKKDFRAFIADKQVQNLCPSLERTCCTNGQLSLLKQKLHSQTSYFNLITSLSLKAFDIIESNKEGLKEIIIKDNRSKLDSCLAPDKVNSLRDTIQKLIKSKDSLLKGMENSLNGFVDIYNEYSCLYCSIKFEKIFYDDGTDYSVYYNLDNARQLISTYIEFMKYTSFIEQLFIITNAIGCIKGKTEGNYGEKHLSSLSKAKTITMMCQMELKSLENFSSNEECVSFIRSLGAGNSFSFLDDSGRLLVLVSARMG